MSSCIFSSDTVFGEDFGAVAGCIPPGVFAAATSVSYRIPKLQIVFTGRARDFFCHEVVVTAGAVRRAIYAVVDAVVVLCRTTVYNLDALIGLLVQEIGLVFTVAGIVFEQLEVWQTFTARFWLRIRANVTGWIVAGRHQILAVVPVTGRRWEYSHTSVIALVEILFAEVAFTVVPTPLDFMEGGHTNLAVVGSQTRFAILTASLAKSIFVHKLVCLTNALVCR